MTAAAAAPAATPWWCWPILATSVLAVSSAAVVFATMPLVPSMTLAAWRLQLTGALLLVGFAWQWRASCPRVRAAAKAGAPLLAASGAWLALHFALWVASLKLTSLPHSVLIISLSPVLLVLHARLVGGPGAVAPGEAAGVALAAAGAVVLSAGAAAAAAAAAAGKAKASGAGGSGSAHDVPASLLGDAAAFAGCVAVIGYLLIGRRLRTPAKSADADAPPPLPLCVYAAPVTLTAAALLTAAGALLERPPSRAEGVFGWLTLPGAAASAGRAPAGGAASAAAAAAAAAVGGLALYGPRVAYLAVGPGIMGHTGFNFCLAHVPPLAVTLALDLECVIAPVMARLAGVTKERLPATTWIGGAMMVAAAVIVTLAGAAREAKEAAAMAPTAGGLEEVGMARLPTHDDDEEEEEAERGGKRPGGVGAAPAPLSLLAHDGGGGGGHALAPEWAGVHRHRQ